ncbi:hypothetical protein AWB76_00951 [Caballeronia temeraria]|uniref:Uncharacterized protein n=1 Tax=Caballeronia temeraria TaxID=1777137 RepID=A0A157ZME1_9BURK|nr:hypothetical protein [Caballeronia temeraria]SAK46663.1 hypothetical protein AWB76_00951 [Caballeronia temeraria]
MLSERLTRVRSGNGHEYTAFFSGQGARTNTYALLRELRQWWKDCVDKTDEAGSVEIYGNTDVTPADYRIFVKLTKDSNVVLFKLRFDPKD